MFEDEQYGPSQIARMLTKRHVKNPTSYAKSRGINIPDNRDYTDDYTWGTSTITHMLARQEYLGRTVNFKTRRKSYKQKNYVCSTYRKRKGMCSSHQIRSTVVEELLLEGIREITALAREGEEEFVRLVMKKSRAESDCSLRENRRELEQALSRIARLDGIIQRLYEDNLEGRISDERFARMSASYETEQRTLEARVAELRTLLADTHDKQVNVDQFLALVRKYTDIQELTSEVLREFV